MTLTRPKVAGLTTALFVGALFSAAPASAGTLTPEQSSSVAAARAAIAIAASHARAVTHKDITRAVRASAGTSDLLRVSENIGAVVGHPHWIRLVSWQSLDQVMTKGVCIDMPPVVNAAPRLMTCPFGTHSKLGNTSTRAVLTTTINTAHALATTAQHPFGAADIALAANQTSPRVGNVTVLRNLGDVAGHSDIVKFSVRRNANYWSGYCYSLTATTTPVACPVT